MELWQNITEAELDRTWGNISSISPPILGRYSESKQNIATKLVDILHEITIKDEQL
jgi:hypothetical protein